MNSIWCRTRLHLARWGRLESIGISNVRQHPVKQLIGLSWRSVGHWVNIQLGQELRSIHMDHVEDPVELVGWKSGTAAEHLWKVINKRDGRGNLVHNTNMQAYRSRGRKQRNILFLKQFERVGNKRSVIVQCGYRRAMMRKRSQASQGVFGPLAQCYDRFDVVRYSLRTICRPLLLLEPEGRKNRCARKHGLQKRCPCLHFGCAETLEGQQGRPSGYECRDDQRSINYRTARCRHEVRNAQLLARRPYCSNGVLQSVSRPLGQRNAYGAAHNCGPASGRCLSSELVIGARDENGR